jgi:amino acid adenylation domain-containing protein
MTTDARSSKDPALLLKLLREKKRTAAGEAGGDSGSVETIPRRSGSGPWPLSFGQERLWLLDRLTPGGTAFNMPFPLRLRGSLDTDALERALASLVERHESLRTTFRLEGEAPVQIVSPVLSFSLERHDLSHLPETEREAAASALVDRLSTLSFDLENGPLYRAFLIRLGPDHHLLLQNLHHIISDGWSTGVLFRELRELLAAELEARPSSLPAPSLQYADFALWQREQLQGEKLERQLSYWRERLEDAAPTLGLPMDRPRPLKTGERNGSLLLEVGESAAAGLRALANRHGASLFMVLLAAWKLLLFRLSAQEDILVGSPIAGRLRRETENLVGFFLNTLVLRTRIAPSLSFRELLLLVRDTVLGATGHQELPFEKLLIELQPERQLSQTPFFQVFFNMANIPDLRFELPGLEVEMLPIPEVGSKFDLNLYVFENDDELTFNLIYNPDLFDRARVREMLGQFREILTQAAAEPETRVGAFDLVTPEARRYLPDPRAPLLTDWPGSVPELFAARAAEAPDTVAAEDTRGEVTYGDLLARVDRLAGRLAREGVGRGEVVAIWAHRSAQLPEALLGILRRGAAFVVLDPAYPPRRLADFLELSRPTALVLLDNAPALPAELEPALPALRLRLGGDALDEALALPADCQVGPYDLAYYAFTSGSTGKPKAILGAHGSLTAFLGDVARRIGIGPGDRNSMVSALSHDPLQRDVFVSLCLGMTVVAPDPDALGTPGYLAAWARERRITVMNLVPAMLQLLCQEVPGEEPARLPELRRVLTIGEVLKGADVARLYAMAPGVAVFNLYGATETQRALSFLELPRDFALDSETEAGPDPGSRGLQKAVLPLGRGFAGAQLLVVGGHHRQAGVGELGEIVFRSRHLAIGYADPVQTADKFAANPWAHDPRDRIYRTGDLGRYLPGGSVEFAGRTDFQVKIRGFRIELPEIEAALRRHPAIAEAVVLLREDGGESRLAAYFTSRGEAPSPRELRELLLSSLPDYMVPAAFVPLDRFPTGRTGKLDRRALPAPVFAKAVAGGRPPATPEEEVLAAIFGQLLGRPEIFRDDNFFELGGHSLLATRLLARARDAFGLSLPLRAVFEKPTLAALAAAFNQALAGGGGEGDEPPLAPLEGDQPRLLSFAQERVYFIEKLEPGQAAYVLAGALRLRGPLDPDALRAAFTRIVARHEALRTRFVEIEGEPRQLIDPPDLHDLPVFDLAALPAAEAEAEVASRAAAAGATGFDLARDRMLRTILLRLGEEEHVLLLAIHHLAADGWSLGLLVDELKELYRAFAAGRPDPLPPLPLQYADAAAWQRRRLQGKKLEQGLEFWRRHLAGAPPLLALPTDAPRPAIQTFAGDSVEIDLGGDTYLELRRFAAAGGFTHFMVLLAAFSTLLGRWAGQEEVVIGTPIASRQRSELEKLIGFFAGTLAIKTDLKGRPDFLTLCRRVREAALGAYAHQEIPFEKLVAELQAPRDLGHTPIFQAMLALQNVPAAAEEEKGGLAMSMIDLGRRQALFDLSLLLIEHPGGLLARLEYNTDLFLPETARRLAGGFVQLLRRALAEPQLPVASLDLLGPADRARLLGEFPVAEIARYGGLAARFHQLAAAQPATIAIEDGGRRLTYGELSRQASMLASRLTGLGARRGSAVAIVAERSLEAVVAQLAILAAGGYFVPLDPRLPEARLRFVLADLGCAAIFGDGSLAALGLPAIPLPEALAPPAAELAAASAFPEELAYAIYTSGSTGTPKAVGGLHGAVEALLADLDRRLPLPPGKRCAWTASPHFDVSIGEVFGALCRGGTLVIAGEAAKSGAEAYVAWLAAERVAIAEMPAPYLAELLALLRAGRAALPLEVMTVGTEPIPHPLLAELRGLLPGTRILNYYGPTETTVQCTVFEVAAEGPVRPGKTPIGRPIANTRTYLADAGGELAPPGVFGELLIGGAGLSRGYLGRPGLTADKFRPDPFAAEPGARLYRSGDLARLLPTGDLEFAGRIDGQLKIRGFRIEPGEIEAALASHPGVRDQLVLAQPGPGELPILVAYVATGEEADVDAAALRRHLEAKLPDYLVPGAFVLLAELPRTAAGKVDKKALPAWRPAASAARHAGHPLEDLLAAVFAEVLDLDAKPGPEDDFFHLGGHSLLATRLVARIRHHLGVELPLREIFQRPTVAALAPRLAELRGAAEAPVLPPLLRSPLGRGESRPPSFGEQRMWFLQNFDPCSTVYHLRAGYELRGPLDREAFERALREIVRRHEVLRGAYRQEGGDLRVTPFGPPIRVLEVHDLSALGEPGRDRAVAELLTNEARQPFDLGEGKLFRFHLAILEPERHVFLATVHHVAFDGWSHTVLMRELEVLYAAYRDGQPSPLAEPALQYADFAAWQRQWLAGEELERQLAFWRRTLGGRQPLELPPEGPRPAVFTHRGEALPWQLPAALAARLRDWLAAEGQTAYMALAGAWQAYLASLTGQDAVALGSPIAGRRSRELEDGLGFFANTLVLFTDLHGNPTFREALNRAREAALDAFAHQDVPFEKLVDGLGVARDASRNPLFQAGFQVLGRSFAGETLAGIELLPLPAPLETSRFDIDLQLYDDGESFAGALIFNPDLFARAKAAGWLAGFETFLAAALENPELRLADLPLMPPATAAALLGQAPVAEVAEEELGQGIDQLFFAQAARRPDAPAIGFAGAELSYGELARRVDLLAGLLRRRGVQAEERVGVLLERGFDLPLALLAVLRAGAAYLPLDPSYPAERLRYMVEAAGCRLVLSSGGLAAPLGLGPEVAALDLAGLDFSAGEASSPSPRPAESLAYVLFTSGSTGKPKGVMVSHRNLVNFVRSMAIVPGCAAGDVMVSVTTMSFDIFGLELYLPLATGAKVELADRETAADGEALAALLETSGATMMQATPATWRVLLDSGWAGRPGLRALCGGEALPAELAARLTAKVAELWNVYGPTETTIWSALTAVGELGAAPVAPLGEPLANTGLKVVDRHGRLLPPGQPGELWISGAGVARGYIGRPALTAERFVPDPFAATPGSRAYRTGDLVRRRPTDGGAAGALEFLGRIDHQVKVRGFRIELGEIEAALASHPAIGQAIVLARQDAPGGIRLVAYWTPRGEAGPEEFQAYLRGLLPDYMVPAFFVQLEVFPLTPSGKVDRQALPAPELGRASAGRPPRAPAEVAIAQVWRELLAAEEVSLDDNFFSLGGDSIVVIQAIARCRAAGWVLKPRDFFTGRNLEEVAALATPPAAAEPEKTTTQVRGIEVSSDLAMSEEDLASLLEDL